jgi:16S rRNA (guanine966-N2)-methyltransferase
MTRIIGGVAGSLTISTPGSATRPTSDRVREAWFSILESRSMIEGAHVLDLFAGSGALGQEAASRGAATVDFVESHAPAARVIRSNIESLRNALSPTTSLTVVTSPVASYLQATHTPLCDLAFLDPPYDVETATMDTLLGALLPQMAEGGLVMIERSSRSQPPSWPVEFDPEKPRKYGETTLYFATVSSKGSQPPR